MVCGLAAAAECFLRKFDHELLINQSINEFILNEALPSSELPMKSLAHVGCAGWQIAC